VRGNQIGIRKDTFPFLSSDGYALRCTESKNKKHDLDYAQKSLSQSGKSSKIYLPSAELWKFSRFCFSLGVFPRVLILADDDVTLTSEELESLFPTTEKIFATNLLGESDKVKSLPLGLESPSYQSGGNMRNSFKKAKFVSSKREISFLASWNISTFPFERQNLIEIYSRHPDAECLKMRVPRQTFYWLIQKSLFVICPRGNGLDTHRIWESLYLGAIPVVHESNYFVELKNWPIWIVEDWNIPITLTRQELERKYASFELDKLRVIRKSRDIYEEILSA
jgi:hypothetical protein